jgi:hypothetical protein
MRCRFCRSTHGQVVVDLGDQPASEKFPPVDAPGPDARFPLRLWMCRDCGLAQLADDVDAPEDPQGTQPDALTRQAEDAVEHLAAAGLLPAGGTVREFPSPHGGTWLPLLAEHGLIPVGQGARADVVVDCCFGIMHDADQRAAFAERVAAMRPGGLLLVQFASLAGMIERREWNAVRHGHHAYYSLPAVRAILAAFGLCAATARRFPLYGGTVLVAARRAAVPDAAVDELTAAEVAAGVLDPAAVGHLQAAMTAGSGRLTGWLHRERAAGRRVYGYSAASRAVALLNRAGVDRELLAAVADASRAKRGTRMTGTDIPVIPVGDLVAARPDAVLLFVPDLLDEVRAAVPEVEAAGGRWVTASELT